MEYFLEFFGNIFKNESEPHSAFEVEWVLIKVFSTQIYKIVLKNVLNVMQHVSAVSKGTKNHGHLLANKKLQSK